MEFGHIQVRVEQTADLRIEDRTFSWVGGPYCYVSYLPELNLGRDVRPSIGKWKLGTKVWFGNIQTRVVETPDKFGDPLNQRWIVVRNTPMWVIRFLNLWLPRHLRLIKNRFIWTLHVWHLAWVPPGALPSYMDIYLVNRIYARLHRMVRRPR